MTSAVHSSGPDDERLLREALGLLHALDVSFLAALSSHSPLGHDFAARVVVQLGVAAIRQTESIEVLLSNPHCTDQARQLIRGLVEIWTKVTWLVSTDDTRLRRVRALAMSKDSLIEYQKKMKYHKEHDLSLDQESLSLADEWLNNIDEELAQLGEAGIGVPNTQKICEDNKEHRWYALFRWESDAVHFSLRTLNRMLNFREEAFEIGVPSSPGERAHQANKAALLLGITGLAVLQGLGLQDASEAWSYSLRDTLLRLKNVVDEIRNSDGRSSD